MNNCCIWYWLLVLLGMASQRIEYLVIELFGNAWMREILEGWKRHERGCIPGFVESGVMIYVISRLTRHLKIWWYKKKKKCKIIFELIFPRPNNGRNSIVMGWRFARIHFRSMEHCGFHSEHVLRYLDNAENDCMVYSSGEYKINIQQYSKFLIFN